MKYFYEIERKRKYGDLCDNTGIKKNIDATISIPEKYINYPNIEIDERYTQFIIYEIILIQNFIIVLLIVIILIMLYWNK